MIGFLAPALLALGVAIAVPLLLHLLQRHQGRRVVFPAIRYLRLAEREHARRIRLRQILLLLLRVSAVLALALAAARPFLQSGRSEHRATAVAIVLDNSLSSSLVRDERRVLDDLKSYARATLDAAGPDDRFWLIRAAEPWEAAPPGDAAAARTRLEAVAAVPGGADLPGAVERARDILATGAGGRATEIHVLTDGQASELTAERVIGPARTRGASGDGADGEDDATAVASSAAAPRAPVVVLAPDGPPPPNLGVAAVSLEGGLAPREGQRLSVAVGLRGAGDSAGVRLLVHDTLRAVGRGAAGAVALLALPAQPSGLLVGRAEVEADALRADDRRYYAARVLPPPAVAAAGEAPFVDRALEVLEEAGRIRLAPAGLADVLLSIGGRGLAAAGDAAVVVVPPTDPIALPAVNRALAEAGIPWRFAAAPAGTGDRASVPGDADLDAALGAVRLRTPYRLLPEAGGASDEVRVVLGDGSPWAVAGERTGGRRYLLVAGALDGAEGDVAGSAAMVPLVDRLVAGWSGAAPDGADLAPGDAYFLPGRADAVVGPDGARLDVEGGAPFRAPSASGVYRVLAGDSLMAAFVVNPPPRESDLARLDADRLATALGDGARVVAAGDWGDAVFLARRGREAWRWIAAAALLALVAEMLIAASGGPGTAAVRGGVSEPGGRAAGGG
ncbi:MAG TPA: VWA domain-containing protein, partial [Longimicrobiales bacterium]|nr:VWA domain-containing protein [Longimicrobiales bacterium]